MKRLIPLACICLLLAGCGSRNSAERKNDRAENDFIYRAGKNAVPFSMEEGGRERMLGAIDTAIGDAQVVAVSEAAHNVKEFISTNAAIVEHLIKNKGFTIVVVESAFPESRAVHDYIMGKDVDREVWTGALVGMYGMWKEFTDMIEWMRDYNRNVDSADKIKFYGLDITGFYTDLRPVFGQVTDGVEKTDPAYARALRKELTPVLDIIASNGFRKAPKTYKDSLTLGQKYLLEEKFVEIADYISGNKEKFLAVYSNEDYEWLWQSAVSLFHTIVYYKDAATKAKGYYEYVGRNGREVAMAQNLQWIHKADTTAKIVIINHNIHTKTKLSHFDDFRFFVPLGAFVRETFGNRFYSIGCAYDNGDYWENWNKDEPRVIEQTPPSKNGEIDHTLKSVGKSCFFIDFRTIGSRTPASLWLKSPVMLREHGDQLPITPDEFDGYIFYDTISIPTENI